MEEVLAWVERVRASRIEARHATVTAMLEALSAQWATSWSVDSFPRNMWAANPDQCRRDVEAAAEVLRLLRDVEGDRAALAAMVPSCEEIASRVASEALYLGGLAPPALVFIGFLTALVREVAAVPRADVDESPPDLDTLLEALPDMCEDVPTLIDMFERLAKPSAR